jgi:hypothetical protein
MTSAIATPRVVEYRFRCFCGAPIVSIEKTAVCAHCGKTLSIRRVRKQHWKIAPPELPHRRMRPSDLRTLAMRVALCLALSCEAYVLAQGLYDMVSDEGSDSAAVLE